MDVTQEIRGDPWFEDGNVVLLTDQDHVAFKVHRGVLARHSEIFQTMFEIPQPSFRAETAETIDGCQAVRMYDLPSELSNLVKALYDGVTFKNLSADDFFFLAGILRLSTKYFINHLRLQAIRHLTETWSYTLRGHDDMVVRALDSPVVGDVTYPYVHPLHVLNLAREVNVRIVLPAAFYFLSLYELRDIIRGDHAKLAIEHPSRPSSQLSFEDVKDYTLMFQHRISVIMDFLRRICGERTIEDDCHTTDQRTCERAFAKLTSRLSQSWGIRTGPMHYVVQAMLELSEDPSVCKPCRRAFKRDITQFRAEIWDGLPGVIGLPSWDELRAMDLQ